MLAVHNHYLTNMEENLQHDLNMRDENGPLGGDGTRRNTNAHRLVVQPDDPDKILEEFALSPIVIQFVIHRPLIQANNFELKAVH